MIDLIALFIIKDYISAQKSERAGNNASALLLNYINCSFCHRLWADIESGVS